MEFEWDPQKAEENLREHGVAFTEAITILGDPLEVTLADPDTALRLLLTLAREQAAKR